MNLRRLLSAESFRSINVSSRTVLFSVLIFFGALYAQPYEERVQQGIKNIYNIRFDEADRLFRSVLEDYPQNPAGRFFLAMVDWWRILIDLENESLDESFFEKLEDVIYHCDQILETDPQNIDALFFKGGAIGFRGRLHALRESYLKAADDGREALPIVEYAYSLAPDNKDILLGFGIYNYYASIIPAQYPLLEPLMIFFPSGDKEIGLKQLIEVADEGRYTKYEARYFLMLLYTTYEENQAEAWKYVSILLEEFPENPAFLRWAGRISMRRGDVQKSYSLFDSVYVKCEMKKPGFSLSAFRESAYYLGLKYKNLRQPDSALVYLNTCVTLSKQLDIDRTTGFLSNGLLFTGMCYDLKGERDTALSYYREVLETSDYNGSRALAEQFIAAPFK